jgi:hypothetical protein
VRRRPRRSQLGVHDTGRVRGRLEHSAPALAGQDEAVDLAERDVATDRDDAQRYPRDGALVGEVGERARLLQGLAGDEDHGAAAEGRFRIVAPAHLAVRGRYRVGEAEARAGRRQSSRSSAR